MMLLFFVFLKGKSLSHYSFAYETKKSVIIQLFMDFLALLRTCAARGGADELKNH